MNFDRLLLPGLEDLYRSTPSPVSRYISPARNDPRYKYIHVAPPRGLVSDDDRVLEEATQRFSNDPLFAERYVEEFISTELQNEIIPDLLIDAMGDLSRQVSLLLLWHCTIQLYCHMLS